jgi:hypothetical protein
MPPVPRDCRSCTWYKFKCAGVAARGDLAIASVPQLRGLLHLYLLQDVASRRIGHSAAFAWSAAAVTQGLDRKGNGKFTLDELQEFLKANAVSLADFSYFTGSLEQVSS